MDRQILLNPEKDKLLKERGYVVAPFLSIEEISLLKDELASLIPGNHKEFYASTDIEDTGYRKKVNHAIKKAYSAAHGKSLLNQYSYAYGSTIVKEIGIKSEVAMHADWSITNEEKFFPVTIWIPLVDTTYENGCMCVVNGSHLKTLQHRGVRLKEYYSDYYPVLKEHSLTPISMKAGEALYYHNGLLHYSPPNLSDTKREAVLMAFYPSETQPVLYFNHSWSRFFGLAEYELTEGFFDSYDKWNAPKGLKLKNVVRNTKPRYPVANFMNITNPDR